METMVIENLKFYAGKRVLITGHTGFKGSWLTRILVNAGAVVTGYSLKPVGLNLYDLSGVHEQICSEEGDIRDFTRLMNVFAKARPEVVFHLAAQPLVLESYRNPRYTYETNVMGTVNVLECVRRTDSVRSFLNVTTDKVYSNREWVWGYRENEQLDGYDPYSNSKSCSELVTHTYQRSFLKDSGVSVSTARAGNVIGGGDFANNRIIPDCVRAVLAQKAIRVRNPLSIRPYQHVLEALSAYLTIAQGQWEHQETAGAYNVGPRDEGCLCTGDLVSLFCQCWGRGAHWEKDAESCCSHEANFLKLNTELIRRVFGWRPKWDIKQAIVQTCTWTDVWHSGHDVHEEMNREINAYFYDK